MRSSGNFAPMRRLLPVLLFLAPASVTAQGVISGTVREDSTGRALEGVEIVIRDQRAVTDARGRYAFTGIPRGNYSALARLVGFRPVRFAVSVGQTDTTWANVLLLPSVQPLEPVSVDIQIIEKLKIAVLIFLPGHAREYVLVA